MAWLTAPNGPHARPLHGGNVLRYDTILPVTARAIAIRVDGRHWTAHYESMPTLASALAVGMRWRSSTRSATPHAGVRRSIQDDLEVAKSLHEGHGSKCLYEDALKLLGDASSFEVIGLVFGYLHDGWSMTLTTFRVLAAREARWLISLSFAIRTLGSG